MKKFAAWFLGVSLWAGAGAALAAEVLIENMTSPEVHQRVAAGATTILIPIGGTEQNGPHMVLGKHNVRVGILAERIAQRLGNTLVAPVLPYVPEGTIQPPSAHMRFSGTISISDAAFEGVLDGAARSFCQHGFRDVVFLGDHGGYQRNEVHAAILLNRAWARDDRCRAHALTGYYAQAQAPFNEVLRSKGFSAAEIGTHAGLADTSLALAVAPSLVRTDQLAGAHPFSVGQGVYGDPRHASAELGQIGVNHIVDATVSAIRAALDLHPAR